MARAVRGAAELVGLNRDYEELGCDAKRDSPPCRNVVAAMARLGLAPAAPAEAPAAPALAPPTISKRPELLVPEKAAAAAAKCTARCGVFGSLVAAALASSVVPEANGAADPDREALLQAAAAAAAVAAVSVCARLCARPDAPGVAAPGSGYELTGTYTHEVPTLDAAQAYIKGLEQGK